MFWGLETTDISKDGDGKEALAWLRGTEANKVINATSDGNLTTLVRSISLPFYFRRSFAFVLRCYHNVSFCRKR